ncbi:MAG: PTS sugar transporter subunit IIA [Treponema sp.]|nr:PTS sugar transporter subunit IIA [Treponema sp.]
MNLQKVFPPESIILDLESSEKEELFEEMLQNICSRLPDVDRDEARAALLAREAKMSTGIIPGVAVPHGSIDTVKGVAGAIGISRKGIDYDAIDKKPVHYVFMLLGNSSDNAGHLETLRKIAILLINPSFISKVSEASSAGDIWDMLGDGENYMEN